MNIVQVDKLFFINRKNSDIFADTVYKNFIYLAKYPNLKHSPKEINNLLFKSDNLSGFLLRDNSMKIIAYIIGEITRLKDGRNVYFISYIYVSESYRKHGYATKLLNLVIDMSKKYQLDACVLVCDTHNDLVYNFYKNRQFNLDVSLRRYERYDVLSLLF